MRNPNVSKWASTDIYTIRNSLWWKYLFCLSDKLCQKVGSKNAKSEKKNTFFHFLATLRRNFLRNKQEVALHELSHYGIKKHNLLWALNAKLLKRKKKIFFCFFPISVHVFLSTIFCCIENILNISNNLAHGRIFKKNDFSLHYCLARWFQAQLWNYVILTQQITSHASLSQQTLGTLGHLCWDQIKVCIQVVCSGESEAQGRLK